MKVSSKKFIKNIYQAITPKKIRDRLHPYIKPIINKYLFPPKLPNIPIDLLNIPLDHEIINEPFGSDLCRIEDILHPEYKHICNNIFKIPALYNRKQWEWVYIFQSLLKNDILKPSKKGLGFGVGTEPLAAIFATFGCEILATDAPIDDMTEWIKTGQHSSSISSLQHPNIIDNKEFNKVCKFKTLDMNNYNEIPSGYDFQWSSCVIEHLGSLDLIKKFLIESSKKLNAGGVAVHTTEFNLTSNETTYDEPGCYVFRRKDLDNLSFELEKNGLKMKKIIYNVGSHPYNYYVDLPNSKAHKKMQLRCIFDNYLGTSIGIVITN